MRVLRGTLTFVLGMVIGIILFVLAIGGTVLILATQMTVGDLQKSFTGSDIIAPDSEVYNKSVLEAVKGILADVQNFDTLSLKTLYEHYGISLINGVSGIDFTDKNFYDVPITQLIDDLSIVVNSFSLNDVSKIAGVNFEDYNLPILNENINNSISVAIDNILGSLNGNMSVRKIKDSFGIDLGIEDNAMLKTLQDVNVSSFGSVINVLRLNLLFDTDTDTFIELSNPQYFQKVDVYEEVSAADLANKNYVAPLGVETYLAGGKDTDGDGNSDIADMRELRFVKKFSVNSDGQQSAVYAVDNSCYSEDFNVADNTKTFYRHIEYIPAAEDTSERFVLAYGNCVETADGGNYTLVSKGFIPTSEIDASSGGIWGIIGTPNKDSKLEETDENLPLAFTRVHVGTSAAILQTIAFMTVSELQNADALLDGLTVADLIDVNDDTAKIIKSLVRRKCKIKDLGSVAGKLPLGEIIDIKSDGYTENANGRYVRFEDKSVFTLYDAALHAGQQRYKRASDGTYIPDEKGDFVNAVYYTLYNAAEHAGLTRYDRTGTDGASSAILQRFAGSTLDGFSTAFDSLMLADVLQIDTDIYAATTSEYMDSHPDERFFRYDSETRVYRIVNAEYRAEHPDEAYFRVAVSGESTAFLKKLAFVNVDGMSDAMELIIDDMMISEIIDVYTVNALILAQPSQTQFKENGEYFIEYGDNSHSGTDDHGKYVFVYDDHGAYAKSNFIFRHLQESEVDGSEKIYYVYRSYDDLWKECGENTELFAQRVAALTSCGNLYYLDKSSTQYKRNIVLCTYMLGYTKVVQGESGLPSVTFPYRTEVFYREAVDASQAGSKNVFEGIMYSLKDGVTAPEYGIYIKDDFRGFIEYDSANPAFADKMLGTFEKSSVSTQTELEYYILRDEIPFYANVLKDKGFISSADLRYDKRRCETVYVKSDDGNFVFVNGQYVEYDAEIHSSISERFSAKLGYIATANETFFTKTGTDGQPDIKVSEFAPVEISQYIRKKSAPVLRLLAGGTLGEMTDVIGNATIGDVVDAESGTLFDMDEIKNAKISEIGSVFSSLLATMTVGDLIQWSNVADINNYVRIALDSVSISNLLHSLEYDETSGSIVVNMLRLYGYVE